MQILKANIKLNKIEGAKLFDAKNGEKFVAIPIKAANIYTNDNGVISLSFDIVENKDGVGNYGDTHYIKLDIGQERRTSGEKQPTIGNAKTVTFGNSGNQPQRAANSGGQRKPNDASWIDDDEPAF